VTDPRDLYGLPLDRFVPERTALVKALRRDGQADQAKEVAALRKPSVAAWAVNQLVRTQAREIAALFAAGDDLVQAQSDLLAGQGDAGALREAVTRERETVKVLVELSRGLLSSAGHELTPATLERVSQSLHAAALDDEARAEVNHGCLVRELRHTGLGASGLEAQSAPPSRGRSKAAQPGPSTSKRSSAAPSAVADKRAKRELAERRKAARQAQTSARRATERAEGELQAAQTRRDQAAAALQEAEDALSTAREQAEKAAREHDRAVRELEQL
jgi:hypothetical protein